MFKNKKIISVTLILFGLVGVTSLSLSPQFVAAQEIPIPGPQGPCADSGNIAECIKSIYTWALGIAVLLALATIIFSGYYYMSSGGDANKVTKAKEMFTNAFIGLIILFAAVLILRTINPDLVSFDVNALRTP